MRTSILSAAIATTLFTAGCFGGCGEMAAEKLTEKAIGAAIGGADVDVDADSGEVTIKGKDGEVVHMKSAGENATVTIKGKDGEYRYDSAGGGKVPDGFPLAVASGAKVQGSVSSSNDEERTYMVTLASDAAVDEVAAFYKRELEAKGLKVERTDVDMDGKKFVTLGGRAEKREASVTVSSADEGAGCLTQISVRDMQ